MAKASIKISILLYALYGGGAERTMLKLAKGIADRGYDVDLILAQSEGDLLSELPKSVRLVDLKSRRVLTSLPALVRYLRKEQPDALLSVLHFNIVAIWARFLSGVSTNVVVSERNTLSAEVRNHASDVRIRLLPAFVKLFYPWADGILAVSQGVADDLSSFAHIATDRIKVIYNPIITPDLINKVNDPLDHPWFKLGEPPVILGVGRLTEQKDFQTLIQAFSKVKEARLLILGEGEQRSMLESLVSKLGLNKCVSMPGFVPNPYPYMVRASVFVLSSKWEGLPGSLIEALFCGAPLIATDCPSGPREILANGKFGELIPVGDPDALAGAILSVLSGEKVSPPPESWYPFELNRIVDQYLDTLLQR
jgi:glycosyltransferase involved in cell wall biosynthesis